MDVSFSDDVKGVVHCVPIVKSVPGSTARISELEPTGNTYNQKQLGTEWSTALMLRKITVINYQLMVICMLSKLMIT